MQNSISVEKCDVQDKERLAMFRFLRRQWIDILNGPDEHAICRQLTALLDADLEFRTINFARKLSEEARIPQNGMIHLFINRGFVAHQAFTIRRITEEYDGPKRRTVYSLPRIVSEVEENRSLITREMYVCADGDPYEVSREFMHGYVRHKNFDELARTTEASRARGDLIHPDVFRDLKRRYKSSEVVRSYANKLLAHAADPATRSGSESFRLSDLDTAYGDLIWLTNYLSGTVLYDAGHTFLPSYCVDVLESIDQPICPTARIAELHEFWSARYQELERLERRANGQDVA